MKRSEGTKAALKGIYITWDGSGYQQLWLLIPFDLLLAIHHHLILATML